MREKYYEDLGFDDGMDIFEKLNINVEKIIEDKMLQDEKGEEL